MTTSQSNNEANLHICLSEPIPQVEVAARYLDSAVTAHLDGKFAFAEELIRLADIPEIRRWTKSIWANSSVHVRFPQTEPSLSRELRTKARMPTVAEKESMHRRDGYNCRFCGMPVIRRETRAKIRAAYPNALNWGDKEVEQHAAFQAMWAQYDHLLPHARGGTNDLENLVLTCAPCNFGRAGYTLAEVGVADPTLRLPTASAWDGLKRFR